MKQTASGDLENISFAFLLGWVGFQQVVGTYASGTVPLAGWSAGVAPVSLSSRALAAECLASFLERPVPMAGESKGTINNCHKFKNFDELHST